MYDEISGLIEVDPENGIIRITHPLIDVNKDSVPIQWYLTSCTSDDGLSEGLIAWLYDSNGEAHDILVNDVVTAVVESKHLIDMHIPHDFNDDMWWSFRCMILEYWDKLGGKSGILNWMAHTIEETRNEIR